MEMQKEVDWFSQMAHALQIYGIYFLLIFVFAWVVVQTSHKYSQSISSGNENAQQMWKWINIAAWGVGGLLTILVACYWIYKDIKPLGYIYEISLEGTSPNTVVRSPQYYQLMTLHEDPASPESGLQANLIADYKFLIRAPNAFEAGHRFSFTIIQPSSVPTTQTVSFEKTDCSGSICKANFQIVGSNLIRSAKASNQLKPDSILAQTMEYDSRKN